MNISKNCRHPRYICDKCGNEIYYIGQKGFVGIHQYCKKAHRDINYKKDFDLCNSCEKKFREWLKTKEILGIGELINSFPRWEE